MSKMKRRQTIQKHHKKTKRLKDKKSIRCLSNHYNGRCGHDTDDCFVDYDWYQEQIEKVNKRKTTVASTRLTTAHRIFRTRISCTNWRHCVFFLLSFNFSFPCSFSFLSLGFLFSFSSLSLLLLAFSLRHSLSLSLLSFLFFLSLVFLVSSLLSSLFSLLSSLFLFLFISPSSSTFSLRGLLS